MNKLLIGSFMIAAARSLVQISADQEEKSTDIKASNGNFSDLDDKRCDFFNSSLIDENYSSVENIEMGSKMVMIPCSSRKLINSSLACIVWKKDNDKISGFEISSDDSALVFKSVYDSHSGDYECITCGDVECFSSKTKLNVIMTVGEKSMVNVTTIVGLSAKFDCSSLHIFRKATFYKHFINNEEELALMYGIAPLATEDEIFLIIDKVSIQDEGWYSCVIYDEYNKTRAYKNAYLHVVDYQIIVIIAIVIILLIIILIVSTFIMYHKFVLKRKYYEWVKVVKVSKLARDNESYGIQVPFITIEKQRSLLLINKNHQPSPVSEYEFPNDWQWEFPRNNLLLGNPLGEGAFGKVVLAEAQGLGAHNMTVAVKMLKDGHTDEDVKDFVSELEIMKMVGKHPNIVNLLGCCSQNGPLYVIVEYALHGNLRDFLRNHRSDVNKIQSKKKVFSNHQLLSFASQIAFGMEHLSSIKCVHRDLAARNILVSEGLIMKIADFGLARDIHEEEYYRKMTIGKLPLRWMAPESMEHRFFDSKSDVWSFGVLLWEIMGFGDVPYSLVPACENLLVYLKQGHRLEQPPQCPDEVYLIMKECWQYKSRKRPSFSEIRKQIDNMLIA